MQRLANSGAREQSSRRQVASCPFQKQDLLSQPSFACGLGKRLSHICGKGRGRLRGCAAGSWNRRRADGGDSVILTRDQAADLVTTSRKTSTSPPGKAGCGQDGRRIASLNCVKQHGALSSSRLCISRVVEHQTQHSGKHSHRPCTSGGKLAMNGVLASASLTAALLEFPSRSCRPLGAFGGASRDEVKGLDHNLSGFRRRHRTTIIAEKRCFLWHFCIRGHR